MKLQLPLVAVCRNLLPVNLLILQSRVTMSTGLLEQQPGRKRRQLTPRKLAGKAPTPRHNKATIPNLNHLRKTPTKEAGTTSLLLLQKLGMLRVVPVKTRVPKGTNRRKVAQLRIPLLPKSQRPKEVRRMLETEAVSNSNRKVGRAVRPK